jgi:hypothetical protein
MILFTRAVARDFRVLLGRCVTGRPRGPAPHLRVQTLEDTRMIAATTAGGVTLTHASPSDKDTEELVVLQTTVLNEVEGNTDEVVTLDRQAKLRGVVRWFEEAKPRSLPVELILPGQQHELPAPSPLTSVAVALLRALHECGRTAARESGRYALAKVQIQGKAGRVVGTDGKVALLQKGFNFPFADNMLVPALPVFGSKPPARISDVRIGRTATHVIVVAGPWSVWLPLDTKAKYPDVAAVIPRHPPTTVTIDPSDAAELLSRLTELPGNDHELRPVTLDADRVVRVRGWAEGNEKVGETREVLLARSSAAGPVVRVALDRRVLARALALGCRTLKLTPDKPVVAEGDDVTLVAAPLDPVLLTPPGEVEVLPSESANVILKPDNPERTPTVKFETNGHPPREEPSDPLALAEELRDTLADAATKANRLVSVLRLSRKEKKALAHVLTSLKQLNLGDGDPR